MLLHLLAYDKSETKTRKRVLKKDVSKVRLENLIGQPRVVAPGFTPRSLSKNKPDVLRILSEVNLGHAQVRLCMVGVILASTQVSGSGPRSTPKPTHMPQMHGHPLDVLKAGLSTLKKCIEKHRTHLLGCLRRGEKISEQDEAWLDNDSNHVDEEVVIEMLEVASDFEHGWTQLSLEQKEIVDKLRELGSSNKEKGEQIGNKRKRTAGSECAICSPS